MQLNDDGTILIKVESEDINSDGSFNVPDGVVSVLESAFAFHSRLKTITFPEGLLAIGDCAFIGCIELQTVTFPKGLHTIRHGAFSGCIELQTVTFPEGLHTIGDDAFSDCRNLQTVKLPEELLSIGDLAFSSCDNLRGIEIMSTNAVEYKRIISLLPQDLHDMVLPMELVQEIFSCLKKTLATVAQTPALNPLHPSFNILYAKDTASNGTGQNRPSRCHTLPPELLQSINSFIIEDNLFYQSAQKRLRGVPWPQNKEGLEGYKKLLEAIANEVIDEAKEFLRLQQNFENQLKGILNKEAVLRKDGHLDAANAALTLYETISASYQNVFPEDRHRFTQECQTALNNARPHLEQHRGWKLILSYLALALTGVGGLIILADRRHHSATGKHLGFFQTDTANKASALENTLESMDKPQRGL